MPNIKKLVETVETIGYELDPSVESLDECLEIIADIVISEAISTSQFAMLRDEAMGALVEWFDALQEEKVPNDPVERAIYYKNHATTLGGRFRAHSDHSIEAETNGNIDLADHHRIKAQRIVDVANDYQNKHREIMDKLTPLQRHRVNQRVVDHNTEYHRSRKKAHKDFIKGGISAGSMRSALTRNDKFNYNDD